MIFPVKFARGAVDRFQETAVLPEDFLKILLKIGLQEIQDVVPGQSGIHGGKP